ncbi:MAG: branched-chain amino acid ABC transporter substrate-binding protein [Vulcanimicrobiaceae bacterium]
MRTRRGFLAGAASIAAAAAAARPAAGQFRPLTPITPPPIAPQTVPQASVAVIGPFSGPATNAGQQLINGVRGAFDDANGIGGVMDHFWTLRPFDDQNTLASALLQSRFAIDDTTESVVIGHLNGKITSQMVRTYNNGNVGLIVPAATTDSITGQGYRNVFRLPTKDSAEGLLHAKFVKAEKRGRRIAVVYQDGDYGPDVASTFLKQTSADGFATFDIKLAHDRPDFLSAQRTIMGNQADLVFFAGLAPALGQLIPALRNAGWNGAFDGSAGFFDPGLWPSYGKQAEGVIVSSSMPPLQNVPAALAIQTQYEQRYGPMTPIAAFAYGAAQVFIAAVRRFNSTSRLMVARALAQPIAFDTLVGSFTFDPFGDPQDPNCYYYQLQNGAWHYVRAAHPSSYIVH